MFFPSFSKFHLQGLSPKFYCQSHQFKYAEQETCKTTGSASIRCLSIFLGLQASLVLKVLWTYGKTSLSEHAGYLKSEKKEEEEEEEDEEDEEEPKLYQKEPKKEPEVY